MPKRSTEFQRLITLINACLRGSAKIEESALLVDSVSGKEREVDIFMTCESAAYQINISIEVRDRKRRADITWIEKMYAKHSYLPTNKLVLISRQGFTESALERAKLYKIDTITFEQALETDWALAARMTAFGTLEITTIAYKCSAICDHPDGIKTLSPVKRTVTVFLPYRKAPTDFDKMVQFFLSDPRIKHVLYRELENTSQRTFTLEYKPQPRIYVLDSDRTKMPLLNFSFEIEVKTTKTPINFAAGRYLKDDVAIGSSSEPGTELHFALVRKEGDRVEGLLLDKAGLRKLTVA